MHHSSNNSETIKKLFNDVSQLNKYLAEHSPTTIQGLKLQSQKAPGLILTNGLITNVDWKKVDISNSKISNTIIKNSKFTDVDFMHTQFKNVIFKNVTFVGTDDIGTLLLDPAWFDNSKLANVKFIHCQFNSITMRHLQDSSIVIEDSQLKHIDFDQSKIQLTVNNSLLDDVRANDLQDGSVFSMKHGSTPDLNFDHSHLTDFKLDDVKIDGSFSYGKANNIYIINSVLNFNLSGTNFNKLYVAGSQLIKFGVYDLTGDQVTIENCGPPIQPLNPGFIMHNDFDNDFGFLGAKINKLVITNTTSNSIDFGDAHINELTLTNVFYADSMADKLMVNTARLDNVGFTGQIDFSSSIIKNLYVHDFHYDANAKVKTIASNLVYNAHGLRLKGVWPKTTPNHWLLFHAKRDEK